MAVTRSWRQPLLINAIGFVVLHAHGPGHGVNQVVIFQGPRALAPVIASRLRLPVQLVGQEIGQASVAARTVLLFHPEQQYTASLETLDFEAPQQLAPAKWP